VRLRIGLVAAIAALVIFPAGAQAARGQASTGKNGADAKRVAPSHAAPIRVQTRSHTRDAGDPEDDFLTPFFINDQGTALPKSGHDEFNNVAATVQNTTVDPGQTNDIWQPVDSGSGITEAAFCNASGSVAFGSTVWYIFFPHRNGQFRVVVQSLTSGFRPTVNVFSVNVNTGIPTGGNSYSDSACDTSDNLFFRADLTYFDSLNNRAYLTGGKAYMIQVGGETTAGVPTGTEGDYTLDYIYDPDTDRDGLFDSRDACDNVPGGPNGINGCPDRDNDNIIDLRDDCDARVGPARAAGFNGCPDSDADGKPDHNDRGAIADRCERESIVGRIDRNNNGCPDWSSLPDLKVSVAGKIKGNKVIGAVFKALRFRTKAPKGTKISIKCRPRKTCKLRKRGSLKKRLRFVSFKRKKTKITIKAKKPGFVGKVFTMVVTYKTVSGGGRNVILRGPKKRCIPVGASTTTKCTAKLLER